MSATITPLNYSTAAVAVGTDIYICGSPNSASILKYDTVSDTISTMSATLPVNRYRMSAAAIGTDIYIFGGDTFNDNFLSDILKFDTIADTCVTLSTILPSKRSGTSAAAVGTNAYVFGGKISSSSYSSDILKFVVSVSLPQNNLFINVSSGTSFKIVSSDAVEVKSKCKNVYRGDASNVAQPNDAYLHDGTKWVNVNTGEEYTAE